MSLTTDLIVISNTCEELKRASLIYDGIEEFAEVIKYALDEDKLKKLIKELK